jgi:uroporphyrinogen-III synthase
MNAVEIVVETIPPDAVMPDWKIYCIGGATFTLVKKYWPYESLIYTANNATELAEKIITDKIPSVTFFCGNIRREELPQLLRSKNIEVDELIVYETLETPTRIEKVYDSILFFSPSAVTSFFSNNNISQNTTLFAIGNTTANTIKQFCSNNIIISDFPAKDQLVDKAIEYYENER